MKLIRKVKQSKINFFNTNKIVIFTYNKLIIIKIKNNERNNQKEIKEIH